MRSVASNTTFTFISIPFFPLTHVEVLVSYCLALRIKAPCLASPKARQLWTIPHSYSLVCAFARPSDDNPRLLSRCSSFGSTPSHLTRPSRSVSSHHLDDLKTIDKRRHQHTGIFASPVLDFNKRLHSMLASIDPRQSSNVPTMPRVTHTFPII